MIKGDLMEKLLDVENAYSHAPTHKNILKNYNFTACLKSDG